MNRIAKPAAYAMAVLLIGEAIGQGLANPTASIGLSPINGTATTAMRSDAAPALNVGISPEWTGNHAFAQRISFSGYGATATGSLLRTAQDGLILRGVNGTANDFALFAANGTLLLRNPVNTSDLAFNVPVSMASNLGLSGSIISGTNSTLYRSVGSSFTGISGGSSRDLGGNILFYGETHSTSPNRVEIRQGTVGRYWLDNAGLHSFNGDVAMNANLSVTGQLTSSGNWLYTQTDQNLLANTTDGADSKKVILSGGGGASDTRGARVDISGNEHASTPGKIRLIPGAGAAIDNLGPVTMSSTLNVSGSMVSGSNSTLYRNLGTSFTGISGGSSRDLGGNILFYGETHATSPNRVEIRQGAVGKYWIDGSGLHSFNGDVAMNANLSVTGQLTSTGNWIYTQSDQNMLANTADGADVKKVILAGGGGASDTRGGRIDISGNEHASTPGKIRLIPGSGANIENLGPVTASSTMTVAGLLTATGGIQAGPGTDGQGRIYQSSSNGLKLRGVTGTSYDFAIAAADNNMVLRVPTNSNELQLPNVAGVSVTGPVTMLSTLDVADEGVIANMKVGNTSALPGAYIGYKGFAALAISDYALAQSNTGRTTVNAPNGQTVAIAIGSSPKVTVNATETHVTHDLVIDGEFRAGTVVATAWKIEPPDYVFEESYELASLDKVETYVKKNKHLPEIPSANSMKQDGVDLVKMNFDLLRKVEELTLYAIDQEKKRRKLEGEVENLKKSLAGFVGHD